MPSLKARWAALAALAALAAPFAISAAHDALPAALTQQTTEFTWDADAIAAADAPVDTRLTALLADPESPRGAKVRGSADGDAFTVTAVWEPGVTVTEIRLDHYTDLHGEGLRIGLAAETTTHTGEHCLAVAVTGLDTAIGDTSLRTCARTDAQTQNDTYPGRGENFDNGKWHPGHLFLTQTAQVTPATTSEHLVEYLGIGANPGDAYESGLWGPNWWQPMDYSPYNELWRWSCDQPDPTVALDDDPTYGEQYAPPLAETEPPALPIPACAPINHEGSMNPQSFVSFSTAPFTATAPSPLSAWARYNDAGGRSQPLRIATAADLRTCDAAMDRCHTDTGADWLDAMLGIDCTHAIGSPCPGVGPGD